ncbi:MAG TPA: site-specific DNA-methyltransferase, partial [Verrucomicrobiota bacterium]|nr:site-specific DNA-methyltransferase [Verrucomicrobiota bacterium]
MAKKSTTTKSVESLKHPEAKRKNIPTAEHQSVIQREQEQAKQVRYPRTDTTDLDERRLRNRDLDPQLVWRGKDEQDWSDLVVHAPPLYIQEKVHPKVLIDDLLRHTTDHQPPTTDQQFDLFADFNGMPKGADKTEFYAHDQNWSNRMILGDSLQVMASLAEREGLRGRVQCIYFDPPYGIKFNSNFQWSTTSRDVKDGKADHITREPEQVKAFRDTWRDGIHSYLTYLRDRLTVARDLLTDSGSIFVQIGDENVHRIRTLLDEVFGDGNAIATIPFKKTSALGGKTIDVVFDFILFYAKNREKVKYRKQLTEVGADTYAYPNVETDVGQWRRLTSEERDSYQPELGRLFRTDNITSQSGGEKTNFPVVLEGRTLTPSSGSFWKTNEKGMRVLAKAGRLKAVGNTLTYTRFQEDFPARALNAWWDDTIQSTFAAKSIYVVQTYTKVVQRCMLMTTDPGDLVLDPTCGSGTTATVAEQWGRRWITIDTSRVALALARARIMGARYPFYLLADSREGQQKEAEVSRTAPSSQPVQGNIRHGFVYERVPHITLKSIANNAEIDVIWEQWQKKLEPVREKLNEVISDQWSVIGKGKGAFKPLEEWEIPRTRPDHWPLMTDSLITDYLEARLARQREIDKSIAAKAEFEYLYDKPYDDKKKVRVAGPFTVESLSPHRVLGVDEDDELIDTLKEDAAEYGARQTFPQMILENLKTAGVQQAHKEDRINFTALTPWPG